MRGGRALSPCLFTGGEEGRPSADANRYPAALVGEGAKRAVSLQPPSRRGRPNLGDRACLAGPACVNGASSETGGGRKGLGTRIPKDSRVGGGKGSYLFKHKFVPVLTRDSARARSAGRSDGVSVLICHCCRWPRITHWARNEGGEAYGACLSGGP